MATFTKEEILDFGFVEQEDGGEVYFQKVLGDDYINDPFLYTEEVEPNVFEIYSGETNKKLLNYEVQQLVGNFNTRKDGL